MGKEPESITLNELVDRYTTRQEITSIQLRERLDDIVTRFNPDGFMLLECQVFDSSRFGSLTILPYGNHCTFKAPPDHAITPRGLASDMSTVVAVCKAKRKEDNGMSSSITPTLTPAYGRDYKSIKEVEKAFYDNKDFIFNDITSPWDGKPCNRTSLIEAGVLNVKVRYAKGRRVLSMSRIDGR